jgi:RNA polymerase-binding transcription factor DksA
MPQKKIVKKSVVKKTVKKAAASKKPIGKPAKNKKPVHKAVSKPAKKAAPKKGADKKPAIKKAKPVAKPVNKTTKKAAVKTPTKVVAKPASRINEKHKETPMTKQKKHDEIKPVVKAQKQTKKKSEPLKEVKLPKITTKTSVPYQPSYKSLEQRQEAVRPSEPLVRYSDTELNEFRELIQRKLESAKKELAYLQGLITRKDDMGGDESENRYMTMEDGSMSMEREQLSQMASRQITYIDHLEKAIIRIENKTYGICRVTGKLIDKARLRAVPHATLSLEAKLGLVKAGE